MKNLKAIKTRLAEIAKDESGQGATEYILVLVGIVAIVLLFRGELTEQVEGMMNSLGSQIQGALNTGG